ncbi:MAG TPA: flavodoxin [Anaerolineaceae bacterium]|nr:flavodoxin [Anaerolineaceae bacterium]
MDKKILVAYFSRADFNYVNDRLVNLSVGNTELAARMVAELTGGQLFKIEPLIKYSTDYHTCTQEAKKDLRANARPPLSEYLPGIDDFHVIVLGYPNYWGTMPMAVWTFLERYEFSGKTILPLCTHEGSGMGKSESDIEKLCHGADLRKGLAIRGSEVKQAKNEIETWLKTQDY